jgi:hypothetical protein
MAIRSTLGESIQGCADAAGNPEGLPVLVTGAIAVTPPAPIASTFTFLGVGDEKILTFATGQNAVGFDLTGAWTGTLEFEASFDGGTYFSVPVWSIGAQDWVTSTSSNGQYLFNAAGFQTFKVRASALSAGSPSLATYQTDDIPTVVVDGKVVADQGAPGSTPWPISGTVTANQGGAPWSVTGVVETEDAPALAEATSSRRLLEGILVTLDKLSDSLDQIAYGDKERAKSDFFATAQVQGFYLFPAVGRRYAWQVRVAGGGAVGSNLVGLRHGTGAPLARIYMIAITKTATGAAAGNGCDVKRATNVAGGTLAPATDPTKLDSQYPDASLQCRSVGVTTTAEGITFLHLGGNTVPTVDQAGPRYEWWAKDQADAILLRGEEGLVIELDQDGSVAADVYYVEVRWQEGPEIG